VVGKKGTETRSYFAGPKGAGGGRSSFEWRVPARPKRGPLGSVGQDFVLCGVRERKPFSENKEDYQL